MEKNLHKNSENMGNSHSYEWSSTYARIEAKHNEAYETISQAISLEEQEKPRESLDKYKKGIDIIDEALSIQVTCPDTPDFTWEKARLMIQKMKKTRAEVLMRINTLQPTLQPVVQPENPPSYEEAISPVPTCSSISDSIPQTYKELGEALEQIRIEPNVNMYSEILYTHEGVKLYFISSTGTVSSSSKPETMTISLTKGENSNLPKGILQIGQNWIYPLVPGASPCFRTEYGAFIFPDIYSDEPGASVGIILPTETDAEVYDLLENILHGIVGHQTDSNLQFNEPNETREEELSTKISKGIVTGAWYLSWGLVKGAEKIGEALDYGTPKLISRLKPHHEPTDVDPKLIRGMQVAECTTKKVAKVTNYVAEQVGVATMKLGSFLAPHIHKQGTRLLSSSLKMSEGEASKRMNSVLAVAAGAVEGFSTIYRGLETSAGILGDSLKNNSVKIVEHKYGTTAGEVAGDTLNTVGNVYQIGQHARLVTPKGFVKRAAKNTGKGLVYELASTSNQSKSLM